MSERRGGRWTSIALLGGGGTALLGAAALLLGGPTLGACSAAAEVNIEPIQLRFDPEMQVDTAEACFGPGCEPAAIAKNGDDWLVPQSPEYLQTVPLGNLTEVTVRAWADGRLVADELVKVAIGREGGFQWPYCPGPYSYLPVTIAS